MENALQLLCSDISEFGLQCSSCASTIGQILQRTKDKRILKALHQIMFMTALPVGNIESRFLKKKKKVFAVVGKEF